MLLVTWSLGARSFNLWYLSINGSPDKFLIIPPSPLTLSEIKNSALTTINKKNGKYPTSVWKKKALFSEHSMIRKLVISAKWSHLKYWISVHLVRHKFGIEHWVRSQRTDRTNVNRDELLQSSNVEHEIEVNAQAIINISRKRLCKQASKETREAWWLFLDSFKNLEPELYSVCVPECVYRNGLCPEFKTCGYNQTKEFEEKLGRYQKDIFDQINKNTRIIGYHDRY